MKKIFLYFLLLMSLSILVLADSKEILVGDLIKLNIYSTSDSEKDLQQKFNGFDIESIKKIEKKGKLGYEVAFRCFEPGEREIRISGKILKIKVVSLLKNENDFKNIIDLKTEKDIDGNKRVPDIKKIPFVFPYTVVAIAFGLIGFILIIFFIFKLMQRRKENMRTAFEEFSRIIETANGDTFFITLTFAFKRFMEKKYNIKILGKTSSEIINETGDKLFEEKEAMKNWLDFSDMCRYAGYETNDAEKFQKKRELYEIVGNINRSVNEK